MPRFGLDLGCGDPKSVCISFNEGEGDEGSFNDSFIEGPTSPGGRPSGFGASNDGGLLTPFSFPIVNRMSRTPPPPLVRSPQLGVSVPWGS